MNLWKTLILAAIVVCVGFYIARIELPKDEVKQKAELLFPDLKVSAVRALSLKNVDGEVKFLQEASVDSAEKPAEDTLEIVDVDIGKWKLDGLPQAPLDKAALNSLVSALTSLKREYEIPAADTEKDLSVYGLKEPALTVTFNDSSKNVSVLVGKESEMLKKHYMKLADSEQVFMGASSFFQSANKKRDDFRDKTPLDFFDSQLAKLQFKNDKVDTTIEATSDLNWRVISPVVYTASNTAVTDTLRNLRNLQVTEYIDQPKALKDYGLEKALVSATLTFNEASKKAPTKVKLGKNEKGDGFYLSIDGIPTVFKLSTDPMAVFNKQLDDFREKQFFKFQFDEVVSAEYLPKAGEKVLLTREGDEWKVNGKNADGVFVKVLLEKLAGASADGFPVVERDYGFAVPELTWNVVVKEELSDKKEEKKKTLVVGALVDSKGDKRYAASGDLSEAVILSQDSIKNITPMVETLLKIEPTPTATAAETATPAP